MILLTGLGYATCSASENPAILMRDGFPFINATINGHGPFRMLIDTGAASCMLTPNAARKAGLAYNHRVILTSLGGEKIIPAASNNRVEVGAGEESGVDIVVIELPQVRMLDGRADGVLGQSFLGRSAYLIDYRSKRLWRGDEAIERADRLPIAVTAGQLHGRTVLPVTLEPGGRPWRLTLDSGATNLVVECSERCPQVGEIQQSGRLVTYVGERSVSHGRLRHVEIGGVTLSPVDAVLVDSKAPDGEDDGVLPARWFSAVYVDGRVVRLAQ